MGMNAALPVAAAGPNPHYERLGGHDAVVRLVDAFYAAMDQRPDARAIRALHADDLTATRAVLVLYLSEWLGGPPRYSAERGAPRLRKAHMAFPVDAAARDAWMACMRQALEAACEDAALRAQLAAAFGKIADHIRNTDSPLSSPRSHP